MTEESLMCLEEAKESMQKAIVHLEKELLKVRAGKANPEMLNGVMVDYYGSMTPISQVANINTPDPRQIAVQPWEKNMLPAIEKAIMAANLGFNPQNNGELIRITVPPLTEERRRDLVKMAKAEAENAKVGVRSARKQAMDMTKMLKEEGVSEDEIKTLESKIQDETNIYNRKVDEIYDAKEIDIMTI
ncbi:MAG: ribosome recycling factor [Bacteroidales bacterium]|nr:ribosome recycling factor [Bacteroidales bacterium]